MGENNESNGSNDFDPKWPIGTAIFLILSVIIIHLIGVYYGEQENDLIDFLNQKNNFVLISVVIFTFSVVLAFLQKPTRTSIVSLFIAVMFILGSIYIFVRLDASDHLRFAILRTIFIFICVFFPIYLYFLFIRTRHKSLFSDFLTNLNRLGLLKETPEQEDQLQIKSYFDRFQSIYGTLDTEIVNDFCTKGINNASEFIQGNRTNNENKISLTGNIAPLPVMLTGVLFLIGWLFVLPPTDYRYSGDEGQKSASNAVYSILVAKTIIEVKTIAIIGAEKLSTIYKRIIKKAPIVEKAIKKPDDKEDNLLFYGSDKYFETSGTKQFFEEHQSNTPKQGTALIKTFFPVLIPEAFAFLGAYFFALQLLVRRFILRDLRVNAYISIIKRMILAIVSVWVLKEIMAGDSLIDKPTLLILAFIVGFAPDSIYIFLGKFLKKYTVGWTKTFSDKQMPLNSLKGLTIWHASRLEEEDIENISNMADTDIVDIILNTQYCPDRLVDWVDEAILISHMNIKPNEKSPTPDTNKELYKKLIRNRILRASDLHINLQHLHISLQDDIENQTNGLFNENELTTIKIVMNNISHQRNFKLIMKWRQIEW